MKRFLFVVTRHSTATSVHPSHACRVNHPLFFLLMTQQLKEWEWPLVVVLVCSMASVRSHSCARHLAQMGLLMAGGQRCSWMAPRVPHQHDHICSLAICTLMGLPRRWAANLLVTFCCKSPSRWWIMAAVFTWHLFLAIFLYKAQNCVGCASHSFLYSTWHWGAMGNWDVLFSSFSFPASCLSMDILTLAHQWLLRNTDFPWAFLLQLGPCCKSNSLDQSKSCQEIYSFGGCAPVK